MIDHNPATIEHKLAECSNRMAKSLPVRDELLRVLQDAESDYEEAYARAYVSIEGPEHIRKQETVLATSVERRHMRAMLAAHRNAENTAKSIELDMRAWQSIGSSVKESMKIAGRGEQ